MNPKQTWMKVFLYSFIILLPFCVFYWQIPFVSQYTIGNDYVAYGILNQMDLQFSIAHGTYPLYVPGYAGGLSALGLTLAGTYHPFFNIAPYLPGYWDGDALLWNTLLRLFSLGLAHLALFVLLRRLKLNGIFSFLISFITVYNLRMLDMFRYGASLENYTGYLLLCSAMAFYFLKPSRFKGPASIIGATYLLICGGHPQMMYLASIGVFIALISIPFVIRKITAGSEDIQHPSYLNYFLVTGGCIIAGLLLSAAYFVPFYKDFLMYNAPRVGQNYAWSLAYSDTLRGLFNSFFNPLRGDIHGAFGSSPLIILIALAPLLFFFRKKFNPSILVLWGALILVFLCALGKETQVHYYFWKYVPLANVFRAPTRITIVFPFLFLLILAWIFSTAKEKIKIGSREFPVSPYFIPTLIALILFLFYHFGWAETLPLPGPYTAFSIQKYPGWVDQAILWLGLSTLVFTLLHSFHLNRFGKVWRVATGGLMIVMVFAQVTIQTRYGTWVIKNYKQPSMESMSKLKKKNINNVRSIGATMETYMVSTQKERSILEPSLAKFYRKYKCVETQNHAYRVLAKENVIDRLVVEVPEAKKNEINFNPPDELGYDWLILKHSTYNRVQFIGNAGAPGFFAFSFPFRENWTATVDGKEAPIYRANGYMQAIYLLPGQHNIEFRYWSKASFNGIIISCITFCLLGLFFSIYARPKKKIAQVILIIISVLFPASVFAAWYTHIYSGDNLGMEYTWNTRQFPVQGNLAYAKKTFMSSGDYDDDYAGLGVDGNYGKAFKTERGRNEWWEVDLGKPKRLGELVLHDKAFQGQEMLPLEVLGSGDGKAFTRLMILRERGTDEVWRIPMQGEIVQVLRLQSQTKASLAFREVEIFPHPEAVNGTPQTEFLKTKAVTADTWESISDIKQAVSGNNPDAIKAVIEKEKESGREIARILKFEALSKAFETGNVSVYDFLRREKIGGSVAFFITGAEPRKVIDMAMKSSLRGPADQAFTNLWNPKESKIETIAPGLLKIMEIGTFSFDIVKENGKNVVVVKSKDAGPGGERRIQFGFDLGKSGLKSIKEGQYINYIVRMSISPRLVKDETYINCFAVSQFRNGDWETRRTPVTFAQMKTHVVSQKIAKGTSQVLVLIQYYPVSKDDELRIEDMAVLITDKPVM